MGSMMGRVLEWLLNYVITYLGKKGIFMNKPRHLKSKNTFIVKLDNHQRDTWQGEIVWADENRSERFRSALELIKLMDEAMNKGASAAGFELKTSAG